MFLGRSGYRRRSPGSVLVPDVLATMIILGPAEFEGAPSTLLFRPDAWPGETTISEYPDASPASSRWPAPTPTLDSRAAWVGAPLAVLLPFDDMTPHRAEAALRFWRHMHTGKGTDDQITRSSDWSVSAHACGRPMPGSMAPATALSRPCCSDPGDSRRGVENREPSRHDNPPRSRRPPSNARWLP